MDQFIPIALAVLPVLVVATAGGVMRKLDWLTEEADRSLLRVTVNFLIPAFILDSLIGNEAVLDWRNVALPPLVGFGAVAIGIGIARVFAPVCGVRDAKERATYAYTVGIFNYGYIPIPLAWLMFDKETVGVLLVHNVGVELALWTFGKTMLSPGKIGGFWKKLVSPPLITICIALTINFGGLAHAMPEWITQTAHMAGACAIPLGLILIGAVVTDYLGNFHEDWRWPVLTSSCLLRLGLIPIVMYCIARYLPAAVELKRVILLQAAMPAAVFPILMAKLYDGDAKTATRVVIATSAVSVITLPLWIRYGSQIIGL